MCSLEEAPGQGNPADILLTQLERGPKTWRQLDTVGLDHDAADIAIEPTGPVTEADKAATAVALLDEEEKRRREAKRLEQEHHRRSAARGCGYEDGDDLGDIEGKVEGGT